MRSVVVAIAIGVAARSGTARAGSTAAIVRALAGKWKKEISVLYCGANDALLKCFHDLALFRVTLVVG